MFVRVRVTVGPPRPALLVPEGAVFSDRGRKVVYVVGEGDKVVTREVTVGAARDGLRVVATGLKPDDRVVVEGNARVHPGRVVKPVTTRP